ncbi:hypothetical protein MNBD_ALPHA06-69 [hydrothermal vent metagenome]|uniref:DUF3667 domain-containing protein n=1 Tax=hydrothermal vent metagenome TaxID=652676 RepID=A0A3B0RTL2_9ZZZZ
MEEEIIANVVTDATIAAGLMPDADKQRANDHGSEFRSPTALSECSNCHTLLEGRYCHVCGQVADSFHRPFWSLFADLFDGLFGFDGRIWRTIPALMLRPGYVTHRYLSGVRKPYLQPIKLFIAASVVFFLVFALVGLNVPSPIQFEDKAAQLQMSPDEKAETLKALEQVKQQLSDEVPEGAARNVAQLLLEQAEQQVEQQSETAPAQNDLPVKSDVPDNDILDINLGDGAPSVKGDKSAFICGMRKALVPEDLGEQCKQTLAAKGETNISNNSKITFDLETRRFLAANLETIILDPSRYGDTVMRWAPRLAFFLAPVFGLLLAISFFWRRKLYLYDHMIVALHFHSFLFLFLAAMIPLGVWMGPIIPLVIFVLWSNIYLYRLHRRIYGCGRITAVLRTFILDQVYLVILSLVLSVLMVLGVLLV